MVTRFGPSPTGFVHMGSLFGSFCDSVFAKQSGGIFYLRIEDTDQKRSIENGIEGIFSDLDAFDIIPDESSIVGGEYGIVYVAHQAYVEVGGGVEIDTIDSYAIKKTAGKLVVKKDVKIGTINIFDYSNTYRANLNIEKGAQVGTIIYHSLTGIKTYTVEEWLAAYPDTEFKS